MSPGKLKKSEAESIKPENKSKRDFSEFLLELNEEGALLKKLDLKDELKIEEAFHNLFNILPVGVSFLDNKRNVTKMNQALMNILQMDEQGILRGDYRKRKYLDGDGTPLSEDSFPSIKCLQEQKVISDFEVGIITESGNVIWTLVSAAPLSDNSVITVTTDNTKNKLEQLAKTQQVIESKKEVTHLISFIENDPNPVIELDLNGSILYTNEAAEYAIKKSKNRTVTAFFPKDLNVLTGTIKNSREKSLSFFREVKVGKSYFRENIFYSRDLNCIRIYAFEITEQVRIENEMRKVMMAVEQSPDSIVITDAEGNIEYVNPKFTEITGYDSHEVIGKNPRIMQSGKTKPAVYWRLWKTIKGGREWKGILLNKRKSGETFWESIKISPVKGRNGDIVNFVAIKEDITDRKKKEERLYRLNLTLKALRHSGQAMILAQNEKDYLQEVCKIVVEDCRHAMVWIALVKNNTLKPVASMPEDIISFVGKKNKLISESDLVLTDKILIDRKMHHANEEEPSSVVLPLKDGETALGIISIYSFEQDAFSSEEVDLLSELAEDLSYGITTIRLRKAHKKAEDELKRYHGHLEELVHTRTNELEIANKLLTESQHIAHFGHWHLDLVNNKLSWSDEVYRMFGIAPQSFGATLEAFLNTVHPDDRKLVSKAYNDSLQNKTNYSIEHRIIRPDKKVRIVTEQCTTHYDKDGIPVYSLGVVQDVTEMKEAEKELRNYRFHLEELVRKRTKQLDLANRKLHAEIEKEKNVEFLLKESLEKEKVLSELKSRFISITSHEFRTPLTSILSSMQLIQRYRQKWSDEKLEDQFLRVKNSIFYLTKLLDDTLTISHADSGRIIFNPQKVDFEDLCLDIIEEVKHKAQITHKVLFRFTSRKREFSLDVKLIRMILLNLLSNAIKYSPSGGKIKLYVLNSGEYIKITVSDEGIGIPEQNRDQLFQPFFRAGNTGEFEGTGLGLSIVKRAVELHKGSIHVSSEQGKGAKFIVKIPAN